MDIQALPHKTHNDYLVHFAILVKELLLFFVQLRVKKWYLMVNIDFALFLLLILERTNYYAASC